METGQRYELRQGDVLEWAATYEGEPFHALLCDPPYHLTSISDRYKTISERDERVKRADPYRRTGAGFMNQQWDGGDIAFRPETWEALGRHLHPGAFIMAFAGTRGYHRQAVAMEDSGLIMHPSIFWLFGSGFPKATRIKGDVAFAEHRYGLQAMKPAAEVLLVFQKPYEGRPVENIVRTGAGALNIGAGRIGTQQFSNHGGGSGNSQSMAGYLAPLGAGEKEWSGRWPANLLLEKGEVAAALDRLSGVSTSSGGIGRYEASIGYGGSDVAFETRNYASKGEGCSRFFFQSDWQAEEYDPYFYCAKSGRVERDSGLEGFEEKTRFNGGMEGASIPLKGSPMPVSRNSHPTIKPLRLTRYLASLLLPPIDYAPRRLLVPFAGVGSEMIGAHLAGWEEIVGVEGQEEYCEIARARLKFWSCNGGLFDSLTAQDEDAEPAQVGMEF